MLKKLFRTVVVMAVVIAILCAPVAAAERASLYIVRTSVSISRSLNNKITVVFAITGTGTMDKIGASTVSFYKADGTYLTTYSYTNPSYSHIMAYNNFYHADSVTYQGTAGTSYYAVVDFLAMKDGGGDTHTMATSIT